MADTALFLIYVGPCLALVIIINKFDKYPTTQLQDFEFFTNFTNSVI